MCGWRDFAWSNHLLGHRHWSFWSICLYFYLFYSVSALYFCICYSILICPCSYGSLAYLLLSLERPSSFILHVYFHRLRIRIKGAIQSFGCSSRWTSKKSGRSLWLVVLRWMCYGQSKSGEGRREKRKGKGAPAGGWEVQLWFHYRAIPKHLSSWLPRHPLVPSSQVQKSIGQSWPPSDWSRETW